MAGEAAAGGATGLLMLFGNGGGVVVIIAMVLVKGDEPTFVRAVYLLYGIMALAVALALGVTETMGKKPQLAVCLSGPSPCEAGRGRLPRTPRIAIDQLHTTNPGRARPTHGYRTLLPAREVAGHPRARLSRGSGQPCSRAPQ